MTQNTPKNQEFSEDDLFKFTMEKKWDKVVEIYEKHPISHTTKLTKSEETALHICISSYHSKHFPDSKRIKKMIDCIEKSSSVYHVLSMKNVKGDTPLHLAAAVGWEAICEYISSKDQQLISLRNLSGETPLFIAAHHGKLQAFLCLHENYNKAGEADESPCRRYDGTTTLHVAISGEYFKLAYQIISYYPKLINSVNEEGESPLHVLARKPNVFKSSYPTGFYDSLIYYCVFVDKLKKEKYNPPATQNGYSPSSEIKLPENYRTCVNIFFLLWTPIYKSFPAGVPWKQNGGRTDEENQRHKQNKTQKEKNISDDGGDGGDGGGGGDDDDDDVYPPNYVTCILLFKFAMKVILSVLGVGYWRIKKIREKKIQHSHAFQIMSKMIESESRYKYGSHGQRPPDITKQEERIEIPDKAPNADEHDAPLSTKTNTEITSSTRADEHDAPQIIETITEKTSSTRAQREHEIVKDENKSGEKINNILIVAAKTGIPEMVKKIITWPGAVQDQDLDGKNILMLAKWDFAGEKTNNISTKDTPILVAAKTGIPEMVKKIISTWPVAIQDQDLDGKNVLMLAAENRQTSVFDYLIKTNLPEYMFHQLDKNGNSILHLAAMLGEEQPWRIPGAALQMQWEIKWYEHVKMSVPRLGFTHHNIKGETPRTIFTKTHANLVKEGNEWLVKTSQSCSVIAALVATVAFATSATVPGGLNQKTGHPILENHKAFDIFSISSLVALCLSVMALVFFLAIITSRCEEREFATNLPRKLLIGLTSLFASIAAMLVSFCAGHTFILRDTMRVAAVPIYAVATVPVTFFAIVQLPLYFDLVRASYKKVPLRSYRVFYH